MLLTKPTLDDISELSHICRKTYSIYFRDYWNEKGLDWYLDKEFGEAQLKSDLSDEHVDYFFIKSNEITAGFMKLTHNPLPDMHIDECVELEKMYVLPSYKDKGIGSRALREIIKISQNKGIKTLFLCVLDSNEKAISFYKKIGFKHHSKFRLDLPYFKDELRGIFRMTMKFQ